MSRLLAKSTPHRRKLDRDVIVAIGICVFFGLAFIGSTTLVVDGKTYFTLADDIMISMTYARNLADGHGLVWTPGETPVEGFTNPLWAVYLALLHVISPVEQYVTLLVAVSGLGCLVAGLAGVNAISLRLNATPAGRLFALLVAASLYAPAFWSLHGFEVGLLVALDTWMVVIALDQSRSSVRTALWLGGLGALALLARLDSVLMTGAIVALRFVRPGMGAIREMFIASLIILLTGMIMEAARYLYYGDLLPNTAYLKLSNMPVLERFYAGLSAVYKAGIRWAPIGLLALSPVVFMLMTRSFSVAALQYLGVLGVVAVQFAYAIYVGGDAWEWSGIANRYLSVVSFILCACAGVGAGILLDRWPVAAVPSRVISVAAAVVVFGWTSFGDWSKTIQGKGFELEDEKEWVRDGLALREATPPGFSYAVTRAGALPYYAEGRRPVDLLGKMDPVIARSDSVGFFKPGHNKYNLDHSLGVLRPDAMLQTPVEIEGAIAAKMAEWGYVITPGGWWVLRRSMNQVDPALLDRVF